MHCISCTSFTTNNIIGFCISPDSATYNDFSIYDNLYLKIKSELKKRKIAITEENVYKEFDDIDDMYAYLDGDIMPMRIKSYTTWRELGQAGNVQRPRTHQQIRVAAYNDEGLWMTTRKGKTYQRFKRLDRFYCRENMNKTQKFWIIQQQKYPELEAEVRIISMDAASTKKIGTRESNNDARNTRKVVLTDLFRSGIVKFLYFTLFCTAYDCM